MEQQVIEEIKGLFSKRPLSCQTSFQIMSALPRDSVHWIVMESKRKSVPLFLESLAEIKLGLKVLDRPSSGQEIFRHPSGAFHPLSSRFIEDYNEEYQIFELTTDFIAKCPRTVEEVHALLAPHQNLMFYLNEHFFGRFDLFASYYSSTYLLKEGSPTLVALRKRARTASCDQLASLPPMLSTDEFIGIVVREVIHELSGKGDVLSNTIGNMLRNVRSGLQSRGFATQQSLFASFPDIFCIHETDAINFSVGLVWATMDHTWAYLRECGKYPQILGETTVSQDTPVDTAIQDNQGDFYDEVSPLGDQNQVCTPQEQPDSDEIPVKMITNKADAEAAVEHLLTTDLIAVDCEGLDRGKSICFIQISAKSSSKTQELVYIFDVRSRLGGIVAPLKRLLESPNIRKVFHDARADVVGIRLLGIEPCQILDTMVGQIILNQLIDVSCAGSSSPVDQSRTSNNGGVPSLVSVLSSHCGDVDSQRKMIVRQRMNADPDLWKRDPDNMLIQYAAGDVYCLIDAWLAMEAKAQSVISLIVKKASELCANNTLKVSDIFGLLACNSNNRTTSTPVKSPLDIRIVNNQWSI